MQSIVTMSIRYSAICHSELAKFLGMRGSVTIQPMRPKMAQRMARPIIFPMLVLRLISEDGGSELNGVSWVEDGGSGDLGSVNIGSVGAAGILDCNLGS